MTDPIPIIRAAAHLKRLGLLDYYSEVTGMACIGNISAEAARIIEQIGEGESVMEHLHNQASSRGDLHIHGNVNRSIVALHSPFARQSITIGPETRDLADALVSIIEKDRSLTVDQQAEALDDAESLKDELGKGKPNSKVMNLLLSSLGTVAKAAGHVEKIRASLGL